MSSKLKLSFCVLSLFGLAACSGGNHTGAIPKKIQPGAVDSQAKAEQSKQESANAQPQAKDNATQNTVHFTLGKSAVNTEALMKALEEGSQLQQQATAENKNINALIGAKAQLAAGTVLTTTANDYAGYAAIRENYADTIGGGDTPFNHFVAIAKSTTTDPDAVLDATYRGNAIFSQQNLITLLEKTNQGDPQYALTLNVTDKKISGNIVNTNEANIAKRQELGQDPAIISFKPSEILVKDNAVQFNGEAQFHYGWGFLPKATGDGKGLYQGVFAGDKAQAVVGTFHTQNTEQTNAVQGAFLGEK